MSRFKFDRELRSLNVTISSKTPRTSVQKRERRRPVDITRLTVLKMYLCWSAGLHEAPEAVYTSTPLGVPTSFVLSRGQSHHTCVSPSDGLNLSCTPHIDTQNKNARVACDIPALTGQVPEEGARILDSLLAKKTATLNAPLLRKAPAVPPVRIRVEGISSGEQARRGRETGCAGMEGKLQRGIISTARTAIHLLYLSQARWPLSKYGDGTQPMYNRCHKW